MFLTEMADYWQYLKWLLLVMKVKAVGLMSLRLNMCFPADTSA